MQIYCSIITIGDELLIGNTIDTNSIFLAKKLNPLGISIKRKMAISDKKEDIILALNQELQHADIIIITGGLGPTSDDITKKVLCEYFNDYLVENEEVKNHVISFFAKRNRPMLDINLMQAMVPSQCEVLYNAMGTAPGMLFRKNNKLILSMPGVPFEMEYIFTQGFLPIVETEFLSDNFLHRYIMTVGMGESFISKKLTHFERTLPQNVTLAYLPSLNIVKLRLSGKNIAENVMNDLHLQLKSILGDIVFSDIEIDLPIVIRNLFLKNNRTLSIAESGSGGFVAHTITSIQQSSHFFVGGWVAYTIPFKNEILKIDSQLIEKYGVVSAEVANAMAQQSILLSHSDIGVGITGYFEKNDHDNTVWMAVKSNTKLLTKKINVLLDRNNNKQLVCNYVLDMLRTLF